MNTRGPKEQHEAISQPTPCIILEIRLTVTQRGRNNQHEDILASIVLGTPTTSVNSRDSKGNPTPIEGLEP